MANSLTKEAIQIIRDDNKLSLLVADALSVKLSSLPSQLARQTRRLTEYAVLKIISDYTSKPIEELIEESDDEDEGNTVEDIKLTPVNTTEN